MKVKQLALELVENSKITVVGSVNADGYPNVKAMLEPRDRNGLEEFYFSTNTSSLRVSQFLENDKACLYFFIDKQFKGIMLIGKMEVLHDQDIKNRLWHTGDERFYPLGVTDPDYCVLKFVSQVGRFYHNLETTEFEIN